MSFVVIFFRIIPDMGVSVMAQNVLRRDVLMHLVSSARYYLSSLYILILVILFRTFWFFFMLSLAWQATSGRAVDSSQALDLGIVTHVIDSSVANNPRVRDERGKVAARIVSILNADTGRSKLVRKPTVVLSLQS